MRVRVLPRPHYDEFPLGKVSIIVIRDEKATDATGAEAGLEENPAGFN